jgi:glutamate/tyrosine decarboxylase-like PLP-dependent enzyme
LCRATWEISPVFAVIEKFLIKYFGKIIGYKEEDIDGMFCPGGSNANTYGMALARHHAFPQSKQKGIRDLGPIVMFVSEEVSPKIESIV